MGESIMSDPIMQQTEEILANYDPVNPNDTARALRAYWLSFEPKSIEVIKAELRQQQETIGIPIPILKKIGKVIAKHARVDVDGYITLTQLLWDDYGREGRVVALIPLGAMEQKQPERIIPLLMAYCRSCLTWEDCDRLAMDALEPVVRVDPERWLQPLELWLIDENKWVRRAGITVIGRLPMKKPDYTKRSLELCELLLFDQDPDVRRATSFAIRLCVRGDTTEVLSFLERHVPPSDPAATWVLCDVIRSMANQFLPEFIPLAPAYRVWAANPALSSMDRRSIESAMKKLTGVF
jgi:3-methyladenine DNA glycosylase AlkD